MKARKDRKTRRRRPQTASLPTSPDQALRLSPEEFLFAMGLGSAAYSLQMPMPSPSTHSLKLREEDDSLTELRFTDVPINRMGFALVEHFSDAAKFGSFMFRFWALGQLRKDPRMAAYRKEEPGSDQVGIHSAVLETAATLPLGLDGRFDAASFFAHVEALIASGKYDDEPDDDPT